MTGRDSACDAMRKFLVEPFLSDRLGASIYSMNCALECDRESKTPVIPQKKSTNKLIDQLNVPASSVTFPLARLSSSDLMRKVRRARGRSGRMWQPNE